MESNFDNAQALFEKASEYNKKGMHKEALVYYEKSAKMFADIDNHRAVGNCFYNSSIVYSNMENHVGAIKCCMRAAEHYAMEDYKQDEGDCYYRIAAQYSKLGNHDNDMVAYYKKAFDIYIDIPNHEDIASTAQELASYYMDKDDHKNAGYYYISCIKAYKELKEYEKAADCYNNIAWISNQIKNYEQAYKCCAAGANFYNKLGITDKDTVANCYANMAQACEGLNHMTDAINAYLKAIAICGNTGNKGKAAFNYYNLAKLYAKSGMFPKAISAIDASIALYEEAGNSEMVDLAKTLKERYSIGNGADPFDSDFNEKANKVFTDARKAQDDKRPEDAIRLYAQYIKMNIDRGNKDDIDVGHAYFNSANSYKALGKMDEAVKSYRQAKAIYESVGSPDDAKDCDDAIARIKESGSSGNDSESLARMALEKISALFQKGLDCQNAKNPKGAVDAYQQAIKIYSIVGVEDENLATIYNNIANAYSELDDAENALSYSEKARVIYEKTPDVSEVCIANCYYNLGNRYFNRHEYAKSKSYYEKALRIYTKLGKREDCSQCNNMISKCKYHL